MLYIDTFEYTNHKKINNLANFLFINLRNKKIFLKKKIQNIEMMEK